MISKDEFERIQAAAHAAEQHLAAHDPMAALATLQAALPPTAPPATTCVARPALTSHMRAMITDFADRCTDDGFTRGCDAAARWIEQHGQAALAQQLVDAVRPCN